MIDEKLTLVLLPGLNGTEGLFKPLLDIQPGNIDTLVISFPTQEHLSYQQLAHYVLEKINHLQGGFILLGESFSGPLSLLVAQVKPVNLKGVILVATFVNAPISRVFRFLPWVLGFRIARFVNRFFRNNTSVISMACRELQAVGNQILAGRMDSVFNINAADALRACKVPIIYFRGRKDFFVPEKNFREITNIKTDVGLIKFNTDHFLLQRAPAEAWSAISQFRDTCK